MKTRFLIILFLEFKFPSTTIDAGDIDKDS